MHDIDKRNRFVELRAKGISLARIAKRIKVSKRTLIEWNRQEWENIRALRAIEIEALQEKILASHEHELQRLADSLELIEERIAEQTHQYIEIEKLYRMAALVRSEIRKVCAAPDFSAAASEGRALSPKAPSPADFSPAVSEGRAVSPKAPFPPQLSQSSVGDSEGSAVSPKPSAELATINSQLSTFNSFTNHQPSTSQQLSTLNPQLSTPSPTINHQPVSGQLSTLNSQLSTSG